MYTVDEKGAIVPYLRALPDEAAQSVREGHLQFVGGQYAGQKQFLEKHYHEKGIDIFVASFLAVKSKNRGPLSYCVWSYGVLSLLPRTEYLAIAQSSSAANVDTSG